MRDKRYVDELSIDELERLLIIRRREARQGQLSRLKKEGRVVQMSPASAVAELPPELADAVDPVEKHINVAPAPAIPQKVTPPTSKQSSSMPTFDDGDSFEAERPKPRANKSKSSRNWTNRLMNFGLLAVEVAAVIGLILLGKDLLTAREDLVETTRIEQQIAQQTRAAQLAALPTAEPTAILKVELHDWILPGGHTFVDDQPMINFEELLASEIPRHLLTEEVYAKMISPPRIESATRTEETALSVHIPRLGLTETIVQGTDWESLKAGVGQVLNGAVPSDVTGTVGLAAHNDIYGELFRHLDQLQVGDEFTIRTTQREYTYRVRETQIVNPTDVWVLMNTGLPTAVLISCYPHRVNNKRIIVFADRID